jgi:hypothetical protein
MLLNTRRTYSLEITERVYMMEPISNPSNLGSRGRRILVGGQPKQNVSETLNKLGMVVVYTCGSR